MKPRKGVSPLIRVRRIPARGIGRLLNRNLYEIEYSYPGEEGGVVYQVTDIPVTKIDKYLGVGDAWAVIHAADRAWDGEHGKWRALMKKDGEA